MYSSDNVVARYTKRAKDSTLSANEREAASLLLRCEELLDQEKDVEALDLGRKAAALYKEVNDKVGVADAVRIQTHVLIYQELRKEASQLAKENLAAMKEIADESGQAKMLLSLAEINSEHRGDAKREEGLEQATEALGLFRKLGDQAMVTNTLLTLCSIHVNRNSDKLAGAKAAVDCASEALKVSRSLRDRKGEAASLHAYAVSSIQASLLAPSCCMNTLHFDITYEAGIEAGREALRIWRELGARCQESYELQCLARWQLVAGQAEQALQDAELSVQIENSRQNSSAFATEMQALLANQQIDDAMNLAEDSLEILRDKEDIKNELRMQGVMAELHLTRDDYSSAMESADEMIRLAKELQDSRELARARLMEAEVKKHKDGVAGSSKEAKTQQRLLKALQDVKGDALQDEPSPQNECSGKKCSAFAIHVQALLANQQIDEALRLAEEELQNSRDLGCNTAQLVALDMLVNTYRQNGQLKEAHESAEEALDVLRDSDDIRNEIRMQGVIAELQLAREEYVLATEAADEMLRMAEELDDSKVQARARLMVAEVQKQKGNLAESLKEAKIQQRLFRAAQDVKGEALALLREVDARYQQGDFDDALTSAERAQEIYRDSEDKTGEAVALGIIAEIYQILDDAEAVLKASARRRSLLKSIGDKRGEAAAALQTCHARLYVLSKSGHARGSQEYQDTWNRAFKEAKDSMTLAYSNGDDFVYVQSFYMLAQVYVAVNDKGVEALQVASQCVEMYKELGDSRGEAQALVTVAHANHILSKEDESAEALTKAMSIFQEIGDESGQAIAMQAMQQFMGVPQHMGMNMFSQQGLQFDAPATQQPGVDINKASKPAAPVAPTGPVKVDPEVVANTIKAAVGAITMMDDVEGDVPLMQAGLTSNTTVLLRNELSQLFPAKQMPFTLVFDHPSVNAIADFIAE